MRHIGAARVMEVIEKEAGSLVGQGVLDVGCGTGNLLRALVRRGARPVGVDPKRASLMQAAVACPRSRMVAGTAAALPFATGEFCFSVCLNSLHHIHPGEIPAALAEISRVTEKGGAVMIFEPLSQGGYDSVMRPIHDESVIRMTALACLDQFLADGGAVEKRRFTFDTHIPTPDAETVIRRAIEVDEGRREMAHQMQQDIECLYDEWAVSQSGVRGLGQPMLAAILQA